MTSVTSVTSVPSVTLRLQSVATSMADTQESVAGQKTSANVDQSGGLLSSLMGDTSVTQRWVVSFWL